MRVVEEIERLQATDIESGYPHWCLMPSRLKPSEWREKAKSQNHLGGNADDITFPAPADIPAKALVWIKARIVDAAAGESGASVPNVAELPRHSRGWIAACIQQGRAQALATGSASATTVGANATLPSLPSTSTATQNTAVPSPVLVNPLPLQPPPTYLTSTYYTPRSTDTPSPPRAPMVSVSGPTSSLGTSAFPALFAASTYSAPAKSDSLYQRSTFLSITDPTLFSPLPAGNVDLALFTNDTDTQGRLSHNTFSEVGTESSSFNSTASKRKRHTVEPPRKRIGSNLGVSYETINPGMPDAARVGISPESSDRPSSRHSKKTYRPAHLNDINTANHDAHLSSAISEGRKRKADLDDSTQDNSRKRLRYAPAYAQQSNESTHFRFHSQLIGASSTRRHNLASIHHLQGNEMPAHSLSQGRTISVDENEEQDPEPDSDSCHREKSNRGPNSGRPRTRANNFYSDSNADSNVMNSNERHFNAGGFNAGGLNAGGFNADGFDAGDPPTYLNAEDSEETGVWPGNFDVEHLSVGRLKADNLEATSLNREDPNIDGWREEQSRGLIVK